MKLFLLFVPLVAAGAYPRNNLGPYYIVSSTGGNYTNRGCYVETGSYVAARTIADAGPLERPDMTNEMCVDWCSGGNSTVPNYNYPYASTQAGHQCFCGNQINNTPTPASNNNCQVVCTGSK